MFGKMNFYLGNIFVFFSVIFLKAPVYMIFIWGDRITTNETIVLLLLFFVFRQLLSCLFSCFHICSFNNCSKHPIFYRSHVNVYLSLPQEVIVHKSQKRRKFPYQIILKYMLRKRFLFLFFYKNKNIKTTSLHCPNRLIIRLMPAMIIIPTWLLQCPSMDNWDVNLQWYHQHSGPGMDAFAKPSQNYTEMNWYHEFILI